MKHNLLASTALVAVGALMAIPQANAANTVKLGVHGYMEQLVGVIFDRADAEASTAAASSATSFDQHTEAEIHFKGSGKLDNGISIIVDVQMEVAGTPGNIIDEQYLIVRGSFGQLTIGSEDNAAHLMTIGYQGSWPTGVGQSLTFDRADWINLGKSGIPGAARFDGTLNDARLRSLENDSSKVSYFTPRFSGFQVGASYIPNFSQSTSVGGEAVATKTAYHEGIAIGVNYNGKFDKVGVGVAFGYVTAESMGINSADTATTYKDTEDMQVYGGGIRIDFGGFRVAAGFKHNEDVFVVGSGAGGGGTTTRSLSGTIYDIGARYRQGPNMVSIGYSTGEMDGEKGGLDTGDEEEEGLMISYARTLGAGVKFHANLMWADYQNDLAATAAAPNANDGWAATTALRISF